MTAKNTSVLMKTSKGNLTIELDAQAAPKTVENFLSYVQSGHYNGTIFHRVISNFMIQVGCPQGTGTGGPGYTIKAEFNETPHDAGILSMARTNDPNSAGSQFFICLSREGTRSLDNQYTVFGKTADQASLDIVKAIGAVKTNHSDRPLKEIKINSARVIATTKPL